MPLPINIADLLHNKVVESARIEYKRDWNPEPIVHTVCAFANDIKDMRRAAEAVWKLAR